MFCPITSCCCLQSNFSISKVFNKLRGLTTRTLVEAWQTTNIIIHRHQYVSCALCSQWTRRDVATSTPTLPLAIEWTKLHSRSAKCEECKSSVFLGRHVIECTTWMVVIDLCLFVCCLFRLPLWRRVAVNHMVRGARPGVALMDFGFNSFHNHLYLSLPETACVVSLEMPHLMENPIIFCIFCLMFICWLFRKQWIVIHPLIINTELRLEVRHRIKVQELGMAAVIKSQQQLSQFSFLSFPFHFMFPSSSTWSIFFMCFSFCFLFHSQSLPLYIVCILHSVSPFF